MWKWGIGVILVFAVGLVYLWPSSRFEHPQSAEHRPEILAALDQAIDGELIAFPFQYEKEIDDLDDVEILQRKAIGKEQIEALRDAITPPYYTDHFSSIMCFDPRHAVVLNVGKKEPIILWICFECNRFRLGSSKKTNFDIPPPWYDYTKQMILDAGLPLKPGAKDKTTQS